MTMTDTLPPDVRRNNRGELERVRLQFRGYVNERGGRWQEGDGQKFEHHDEIPHPCILVDANDSTEEIERKRTQAIRTGADFYDPRSVDGQVVGWLRGGRKREREWLANMGESVIKRERRLTPVAPDEDDVPAASVKKAGREPSNGT